MRYFIFFAMLLSFSSILKFFSSCFPFLNKYISPKNSSQNVVVTKGNIENPIARNLPASKSSPISYSPALKEQEVLVNGEFKITIKNGYLENQKHMGFFANIKESPSKVAVPFSTTKIPRYPNGGTANSYKW